VTEEQLRIQYEAYINAYSTIGEMCEQLVNYYQRKLEDLKRKEELNGYGV